MVWTPGEVECQIVARLKPYLRRRPYNGVRKMPSVRAASAMFQPISHMTRSIVETLDILEIRCVATAVQRQRNRDGRTSSQHVAPGPRIVNSSRIVSRSLLINIAA